MTPNQDTSEFPLHDKLIYIIGPRRLQNEMMARLLENQTGAQCVLVEKDLDLVQSDDVKVPKERLILIDCLGKKLKKIKESFESEALKILMPFRIALIYNIFKKINVTNRLQAALWAAKNL